MGRRRVLCHAQPMLARRAKATGGPVAAVGRARHVGRSLRWREELRLACPPIFAWLVVLLGFFLIAQTLGFDATQGQTWFHWDSGWYRDIARKGYFVRECLPEEGAYPYGYCGSGGWFPGYSLIWGGLLKLGAPLVATGVALSWLFALATLVALWRFFLVGAPALAAAAALAFAAFHPGQGYSYAAFPLSMLTCFSVLSFGFASRERWLATGVCAAVAGTSYHVGALLPLVLAVWVLATTRGVGWRERGRRLLLTSGVASLGPLFVVLLMRIQTGYWDVYLRVQEKYNLPTRWPWDTFLDRVRLVFVDQLPATEAPFLQTLLVGVTLAVVLVALVVRRRQVRPVDWLVLTAVSVFWVAPLISGASLHRVEAAVLPVAALLRYVPPPITLALAAVALWNSIPMLLQFWNNTLV